MLMFGETEESVLNEISYIYSYRTIRTDVVPGYAMALCAKGENHNRAVGIFAKDFSSEGALSAAIAGFMHLGVKIERPHVSFRGDGHEDLLAQKEVV